MSDVPEFSPGIIPAESPLTDSVLPVPPTHSFLQRRRHQLIGEIAELRSQQAEILNRTRELCESLDHIPPVFLKLQAGIGHAQWTNDWDRYHQLEPEFYAARAANEDAHRQVTEHELSTYGQVGELQARIVEMDCELQELTLACIQEAEQQRATSNDA